MKAALKRYDARMAKTWADETAIDSVRFVSIDTESTGIDPLHDFLVAYGGIAVLHGEICLDDAFEATIRRPFNDANVTLHGITRENSRTGDSAERALTKFLDYIGDGVLVGHHIEHDFIMINVVCNRFLETTLRNRRVDTMGLALHLERDGVLPPASPHSDFSLDGLCARFHIAPHDRHTAAGDAFLTAQVFLKLLPYARRAGRTTLARITEPWRG